MNEDFDIDSDSEDLSNVDSVDEKSPNRVTSVVNEDSIFTPRQSFNNNTAPYRNSIKHNKTPIMMLRRSQMMLQNYGKTQKFDVQMLMA
jgi:hypothetical protein